MAFLMSLMREKRAPGADGKRDFHRAADGQVGRVRPVAQAVDDQDFNVLYQRANRLGDGGTIAEVREELAPRMGKEKAERGDGPVRDGKRRDFDSSQLEALRDNMRQDMDVTGN